MIENLLIQTEKFVAANVAKYTEDLLSILKFSNITTNEHQLFNDTILEKACINLHFHPDRFLSDNKQVIDGLIETGVYKNQFQTGVSSGSLTAKTGEDREMWENELFDNFYTTNIQDRPKYGSLNLTCTSDGASPRFGSCFFITYPEIKYRCTFTYGDSYLLPQERGTAKKLIQIYTRLYQDIFIRNTALGFQYKGLRDFFNQTTTSLYSDTLINKRSHNLDFYIEAQIHGHVDLEKDISTFVADYSFKGTEFEDRFKLLCERFNISFVWNAGYTLDEADFPNDFRGTATQDLAKVIADDGVINAYTIGKAFSNSKVTSQYGDLELFQLAKYVWHCLVKYGE
ncbi:DUF3626 domain-containing protein [Chitinophaga pendula]|uniref:DUF3626 domain-containing protein n=1 Tax=Chitinophaga TaxID=79328 RepID=UPI000BB037DB|nr:MULTISPECIES: DUF3626 domain-containing protein [Chitinophaga]ASZ09826.1 hypothetical protein CK934_01935 [Chitinophaga sp. MD30]UCJ07233.1 DUF3626 domain-containing protein [Chitinophaga pendula]